MGESQSYKWTSVVQSTVSQLEIEWTQKYDSFPVFYISLSGLAYLFDLN